MREILFRGKRLDDDKWVTGYYTGPVGLDMSHEICDINSPVGSRVDVDPDTVGQYTGLTDMNGTKIFEGDVLRFYSDYTDEFMGDPCIARYGEFNCTCCEGVYGWYFEGGDIRDHDVYVVIGNIHDNPELMEVHNG